MIDGRDTQEEVPIITKNSFFALAGFIYLAFKVSIFAFEY